MRNKVLKVSALAVTIAASFSAHSAIYQIHKVDVAGSDVMGNGVAVAPDARDCWTGTDCNATPDSAVMAVESKKFHEGFSYRDESPFFLVDGFNFLDDNYDGFRNYCDVYLRYQSDLCEKWAVERWNGYNYELSSNYDNSLAYIGTSTTPLYADNTVINELVSGSSAIGNRRDTNNNYRNLGFSGSTDLTVTDTSTFKSSHAWRSITAQGKTFVVGSVTRDLAGIVNDADTVSKAAVWDVSAPTNPIEIDWSGAQVDRDRIVPQGSARDIVEITNDLYAVGYNSDSDERLRAAVFYSDDGSAWSTRFVSTPQDIDYLANYTLQVVNENKLAVGTYKLKDQAQNGSFNNGLFYVSDVTATNPSSTNLTGGIFFAGANGKVGNINNKNELVGTVDYETHTENNGKPRAQRAFVTVLGDTSLSTAPFKGSARYLDDLTLGLEANNAYRIFEASDINEAGVISATAYYCAGGYDSSAIDSVCNKGAAGSEKVVAVKLIPIQGATAADIQARPKEEVTVERQGASLGWLALGLLGLLGFRRK